MNFILAGEGPSDLGAIDFNGALKKGPMTFIIDWVIKNCPDSPEATYELFTETKLKRLKKDDRRNISGKKKECKPHEAIYLTALYLGQHGRTVSAQTGSKHGVVFFKDCDGTNSAPRNLWESMVRAMQAGFSESGQGNYCVPMVPRPKSEAWLMAYYQCKHPGQSAYNACSRFEEHSGNDASPNALKKQLKEALETEGDVYDLITESEIHSIDWNRVDMPSFNLFKKKLENVLAAMQGRPFPNPISEILLSASQ